MTAPTDGPQAAPGGQPPAPDTDPQGLPIRARLDAPTTALDLGPPTAPDGITLPPVPRHSNEVQRALDRHIPLAWHDTVRQLLPLVVPLARVVLEICEEVHGNAKHPTLP